MIKQILESKGYTVYNPNTDNAARFPGCGDDVWLRTFNEELEKVKETYGFMLQIQQWTAENSHVKTPMQEGEQRQATWCGVPKVAITLNGDLPERLVRMQVEAEFQDMIEECVRQWNTPGELCGGIYSAETRVWCVTEFLQGTPQGWT